MNQVWRNVSPIDLRDLARSWGWEQMREGIPDGLVVLKNGEFPRRQLVFPFDVDVVDYEDAIEITLNKLSDIHKKSIPSILSSLDEVKDDTVRFKVIDPRHDESYIPLSYAANAINGAKELLLSAACTVLKPQAHHPRLYRSEAQLLVDKSRFRHTEKGSYVLNVSIPVQALEFPGTMQPDLDIPFVRQATLVINNGLSKLVRAIQCDTLDSLIDSIKDSPAPEISSNLCKALISFQDDQSNYDLHIDFGWAGSVPIQGGAHARSIKIQRDYFSRIDDVRRELKRTESNNLEDTFIATVEHLSGDWGVDGKRSGEVILNLYKDDEIVRARTNLDSEHYADADKSHMTPNSYIKIRGKLYPGNQPRLLREISLFEYIAP